MLLLALACSGLAEPAPPTPEAPVSLPTTLSAVVYDRVRADPQLGPFVDTELIPALSASGPAPERVEAFLRVRREALAAYQEAVAKGARPAPSGPPTVGPGPDQVLADFDAVCEDLARAFLRSRATQAEARKDTAALTELEGLAVILLDWSPSQATSLQLEMQLSRSVIEGG